MKTGNLLRPNRWFQLSTPPMSADESRRQGGGSGAAGSSRHPEIYDLGGGGVGGWWGGCRPLPGELSSQGNLNLLEPSSTASTRGKTPVLTCRASFVLQGSILTFDPGAKAEMARQRSCCRIRGSISSHLWKLEHIVSYWDTVGTTSWTRAGPTNNVSERVSVESTQVPVSLPFTELAEQRPLASRRPLVAPTCGCGLLAPRRLHSPRPSESPRASRHRPPCRSTLLTASCSGTLREHRQGRVSSGGGSATAGADVVGGAEPGGGAIGAAPGLAYLSSG